MGKLYLISGDDDFARKQHARETILMAAQCDEPENADHVEIVQGDLPELKPDMIAERFLEALRTPPFLAPEKVVWMRHHPDLDSFTVESAPAAVKELVAFLSETLPEELTVIIDGPGIDKRKTLWKNLQKLNTEIALYNVARSTDRNFAENRRNVLNRSYGKGLSESRNRKLYLIEVLEPKSHFFSRQVNARLFGITERSEIFIKPRRTHS